MPDLPHSPHPATAAVLAVMPKDSEGYVVTHFTRISGADRDTPIISHPEPLAAKYAAAVLRWAAREATNADGELAAMIGHGVFPAANWLTMLAGEIEGTVR